MLMNNGRQGFGANDIKQAGQTAFPCQLAVTASWDRALYGAFGEAMGQEFFAKGANVALAPMLILARVPHGGRNLESIGEDGEVGYEFAKAQITGLQSVGGVIANADDFVLNNQETGRMGVDSVCDERTMRELYYRAYEGAVAAGVGSFMCSYNKVNGVYACENNATLGALKSPTGLNFSGWVMSDWAATHSTVASALAGLDQEMSWYIYYYTSALEKAVASGAVPLSRFNDMVTRILTQMFKFGLFDIPPSPLRNPNANVTSPARSALARTLAAAGTVLLSNPRGLLPVPAAAPPRVILVLGDAGHKTPQCCLNGGGSGDVTPPYIVTPLQGITARAGATSTVSYLPSALGVQPLTQYYSAGRGLHYLAYDCYGCPAHTDYAPLRAEGFALQDACPPTLPCTTLVILYNSGTGSNAVVPSGFPPPPGYALWGNPAGWALPLNYSGAAPTAVLELWSGRARAGGPLDYFTLATNASRAEALAANYTKVGDLARVMLQQGNPANPNPMVQAALAADLVVVVAALTSDEGSDRDPSLALAPVDDAMISAVTAAQPNTVVVLNAPGAVVMPWADAAGAIICNWFAGQEEGNALADILWGDVNPSGRTTVTFPVFANDSALNSPQQWPGVNGEVTYTEKLEVGYRFFDAHNVTPRFPFGHGLSYTRFEYTGLFLDTTSAPPSVFVNFTLRNAGTMDGKEIAQLYVGYPPAAGEPPKLLRDFAAVRLEAGESAPVALVLEPRDLQVWDAGVHAWAPVSGTFTVFVGASSRDVRLQGQFIQ